jgi:5-(hydroxymethyl)furfural/furfural oxidase
VNTEIDPNQAFDVIIAGAGPAGCVLAGRLSEVRDKQVLLIEAGADVAAPGAEHPDVLDPFCLPASYNQLFHWPGLRAETQIDPAGPRTLPGRYIQARGVGGASNINGMGADRGLPADYDGWQELGAEDWSWRDVLPYFRKLEHDMDFSQTDTVHGTCGPMPVRRLSSSQWAPFAAATAAALQRRGFRYIEDYMSDFGEGFAAVPTNCLPERRVSAAMAYLTREVRRRPNLQVLTNTRIDRLRLEGTRACGVFAHKSGATQLIRGRQIVVACGAIHSPALLLRSGIGAHKQLTTLGLEVIHDLPGVGAHLQNHPSVALPAYLSPGAAQPAENRWLLQNWLRFSSRVPSCEPNDMHLMAFNKCAWHALGARVGAIVVSLLRPYSTGTIQLTSADPSVPPRIQFNSQCDPRDFARLVDGVRFALELLADPAVASLRPELFVPNRRLVASLSRRRSWSRASARALGLVLDQSPLRRLVLASARIHPGELLGDHEKLQEFARSHAGMQYHVCSTCRMGRRADPHAVVDSGGRVHGIRALRVVDASIFPLIPRGYPHFIVLMAAEKIADAIKLDWHAGRPDPAPIDSTSLERSAAVG